MDIQSADNFSPYEVITDTLSDDSAWSYFGSKYSKLTPPLLAILLDLPTMEFLAGIAEDFNLSLSQSRALSEIVGEIVLGDMFIGDTTKTVIEKLGIDTSTGQQIVSRILQELFAPAIEDIKKIQREKFPDRIKQGSPPATPARPAAPAPTSSIPPVSQDNIIDLRNQS